MKITKVISLLLVGIISSFFFVNKVNAYITVTSEPAINRFTIASNKQVTYVYSYIDENSVKHTLAPSEVVPYPSGTVLTLADRIDNNVDYDQVRIHINNTTYTNSTYTVIQDVTIEYVYYLNTYSITYNLDGGSMNNPIYNYTSMTPTFNIPTPTKNNYTFVGWTGSNGTTPQTSVSIGVGSTGNKTYTANWQTAVYNVTHNTSNRFTYTGAATATAGSTYTATVRTQNRRYYVSKNSIVKMNGVVLSQDDYTINETSSIFNNYHEYEIQINNVSGDIDITIEVTTDSSNNICLAEGTLIMLWDGSYKKIEDIRYNDLLKVWNHDTGSYGYEYAGWIEQEGVATEYTKVTFSDGNELKVVGNHSVFSKTLNKYVDINSDEFNIGDEVINLSNGINYVTVTNIEHVNEEVRYYHVISTRYFNLITNEILTTYEIYNNVSNFMGFGENLKWQNTEIVRSDMYTYEDFQYLEKYLFKVFRLEETKYLVETGLVTPEEFEDLYNNYLMDNDKKVIPPRNEENQYLWMVATSDDEDPSDTVHQMIEGSIYTVPTPINEENFLHWYNHSDNKYYQPGDEIEVDSSMYLEAIYN